MNSTYWPWWLGGTALAIVAVLHPLLIGRPLGVSGVLERALARVLGGRDESTDDTSSQTPPDAKPQAAPVRKGSDFLFLAGLILGGALAGWGNPTVARVAGSGLSPEFHRIFGQGALGWIVLLVGGALVGFGTRWSGGCTSGHGLSGVGRLHPSSLAATATFFGVAIGVSFLLERLLA
jgi:uncharacterized membrane protein YedE/YeeE